MATEPSSVLAEPDDGVDDDFAGSGLEASGALGWLDAG
jgi:hypothetical protein